MILLPVSIQIFWHSRGWQYLHTHLLMKSNIFPRWIKCFSSYIWPIFINLPKLSHENEIDTLHSLSVYAVSSSFIISMLEVVDIISSQLSTADTFHSLFKLYTHGFPLEFSFALTGISWWPQVENWKFYTLNWHALVNDLKH